MRYARFEVFREVPAADGPNVPEAWRWRLVGANGEKTAQATEAYSTRSNAIRACHDVMEACASGPDVVTVDA